MTDRSNRSLMRAAAILDCLEHDSLTLSQLASRTGVSTSSVHRLMTSLEDLGFVRRTGNGSYVLGRRFQRSTMEATIRHTLARIRDETGESCQFWIKLHQERLCVAIADSGHELRPILAEGTRIPLAAGGSAGDLLNSTPRAVESLKKYGWVESVDGRTPGLSSLSFPLVVDGRRQGAVCLVVPSSRLEVSPGMDHGHQMEIHMERLRGDLAALL